MIKQHYSWILPLLCMLLFQCKGNEASDGFKVYSNDNYEVEISYPSYWQVNLDSGQGIPLAVIGPENQDNSFRSQVVLTVRAAKGQNLNQILSDYIKRKQNSGRPFRMFEEGVEELDSRTWQYCVFRKERGEKVLKVAEYMYVNNDKWYSLKYTTAFHNYKRDRALFDQIKSSLKITAK